MLNFDIVVIGSGPSGMTAAIYAKRAGLSVALIEASAPGGQINKTAKIENYPGFSTIDGPTLAYNMFTQANSLGITYKYAKVAEIIDNGDHKVVKTNKEEITCKAIIIATGRKAKELGLENEKGLTGRGIGWCATCDGPLFKDKHVAVVGGGNSALEESLQLATLVGKITLIHRRDEFRGDKILAERVINNPKIEIMYDNVITKINALDNHLDSIDIENVKTKEQKHLEIAGLFIYIGFEPALDFINNINLNMKDGYIVVDENMRTNIKNIYACGDIIKKELYQIVTAVSEGAIAAVSALRDLNEE
jgi:thioredoxin reductase (NADPH)